MRSYLRANRVESESPGKIEGIHLRSKREENASTVRSTLYSKSTRLKKMLGRMLKLK